MNKKYLASLSDDDIFGKEQLSPQWGGTEYSNEVDWKFCQYADYTITNLHIYSVEYDQIKEVPIKVTGVLYIQGLNYKSYAKEFTLFHGVVSIDLTDMAYTEPQIENIKEHIKNATDNTMIVVGYGWVNQSTAYKRNLFTFIFGIIMGLGLSIFFGGHR